MGTMLDLNLVTSEELEHMSVESISTEDLRSWSRSTRSYVKGTPRDANQINPDTTPHIATMSFVPYDPSSGKTYPAINPQDIARIEIFPPVGIARVGDSGANGAGTEIQYFYGPEVPGIDDHPFGEFRDPSGGIKRQAARFRVFAYDQDGKVLGEINHARQYQLKWTVHVANKKGAYFLSRGRLREPIKELRNPDVDPVSTPLTGDPFDPSLEGRSKLIIDPGEKTIERGQAPVPLNGGFQGSGPEPTAVNLGELRTDGQGRLVFLGGSGYSHSLQQPDQLNPPEIISEFDSIDWVDNVCDGWVSVAVSHPNRPGLASEIPEPHKATVVSAPPKFAWGIDSPTSLYDLFEDFYKDRYLDHLSTEFYKDIWPVLYGTYKLSWVNNKAFQGHGPGGFGEFATKEAQLSSKAEADKPLREHIFETLRQPDFEDKDQANVKFMPRLSGDNGDAIEPGAVSESVSGEPIQRFAALTALQYNRFRSWRDGLFIPGDRLGMNPAIEDYAAETQPALLARAMLEQTIGDPLYPGIETFWIAKRKETYDFATVGTHMRPPFRIDHENTLPGWLTRGLSLPWQSDFDLCNTHWWPSARPDDIVPSGASAQALLIGGRADPALPPPRYSWADGLRDTPEAFFPGSTDMIKLWHKLGFVAKEELVPGEPPAWIEQERALPHGFVPQPIS
ncbi:hypothetical protein EIP86_003035 [Pleurotus ostreatoroseus]|nr:hypothetical protein EIP86_003035 [Pleurotus ostreatoroseus]